MGPSDVNNLREKVKMLLQVNRQKRDFWAVFLLLYKDVDPYCTIAKEITDTLENVMNMQPPQ